MDKYYIKEMDWEKIYTFLKSIADIRVENERKTRFFAEGVYFIMRTGAQWRELPGYYDTNGEVSINALNNGPIKDCGTKSLFILQKDMMENP